MAMRILVADDDPVSLQMLEGRLADWGYHVTLCRNGDEAWTVLHEPEAPKLAVLDWVMPGRSGADICREIRGQSRESYTYLLLLTARDNQRDVVEGLRAGADDYLTKPVDWEELQARLYTARRVLHFQDQLITAKRLLGARASCDPLTGLLNRRAVVDHLRNELARASRSEMGLGLILLDLDEFKLVNDRHGHLVGDAVLKEVARRIQASVRCYDAVGRYGGEEFLVVVPGCDLAGSEAVAERLRAEQEAAPCRTAEAEVTVTISLGVTAVAGGTKVDSDTVIRFADRALYRAKEGGRNRVDCEGAA